MIMITTIFGNFYSNSKFFLLQYSPLGIQSKFVSSSNEKQVAQKANIFILRLSPIEMFKVSIFTGEYLHCS
jgi:hypothetical protein